MVEYSNFGHGHLGMNRDSRAIAKSPPPPRVYNVSKNDFRSVVQQLTGSPSRHPPPARPATEGSRLQRGRPPPLARAPAPPPSPPPPPRQAFPPRLPVAESPVSAYMGSLQSLIMGSSGRPTPRRQGGGHVPLSSPTWSFLELLSPPPKSEPASVSPGSFLSASSPWATVGGAWPASSPGGLIPASSSGLLPILSPGWRS